MRSALCVTVVTFLLTIFTYLSSLLKGKGFPILDTERWPGADPGVQAVSLQVTVSHPPGGRLSLLSPGLRLPPQPQSIATLWPIPSYTAW